VGVPTLIFRENLWVTNVSFRKGNFEPRGLLLFKWAVSSETVRRGRGGERRRGDLKDG